MVLAVCSAAGEALDPLIVFKGTNLQSTWKGKDALPNTYYSCSQTGWMKAYIFHDWFQKFVELTKDTWPLILLFDGHPYTYVDTNHRVGYGREYIYH